MGFFSRDIIDQEIRQLCERYPEISEENTIVRKAQGRYRINGREVPLGATRKERPCEVAFLQKASNSSLEAFVEALSKAFSSHFEGNSRPARSLPRSHNRPFRLSNVFKRAVSRSVSLVTREARDEESEAEALPLGPDDLVVRDGPLTQPFLEYVFDTGEKATELEVI